MSYTVRGYQGVTRVKRVPTYNAETRVRTFTTEYRGTEEAVRGLELQLTEQGLSYRIDQDGPVWSLFVDEPIADDVDETIDRWEIFTENAEKSLFELPSVVPLAITYDGAKELSAATFKSEVETAATSGYSEVFSGVIAGWSQDNRNVIGDLISHLRAGVTGWQLDLVGIRRTRRLQAYTAQGYRVSLDSGLYVYTTGQLGVPQSVAFALPITPENVPLPSVGSALFRWGWRKRSQRVEIIGPMVEQTVELLFAPWSTLAYSDATGSLAWT